MKAWSSFFLPPPSLPPFHPPSTPPTSIPPFLLPPPSFLPPSPIPIPSNYIPPFRLPTPLSSSLSFSYIPPPTPFPPPSLLSFLPSPVLPPYLSPPPPLAPAQYITATASAFSPVPGHYRTATEVSREQSLLPSLVHQSRPRLPNGPTPPLQHASASTRQTPGDTYPNLVAPP